MRKLRAVCSADPNVLRATFLTFRGLYFYFLGRDEDGDERHLAAKRGASQAGPTSRLTVIQAVPTNIRRKPGNNVKYLRATLSHNMGAVLS